MVDRFQTEGQGPVWRPTPDEVRDRFREPLPTGPAPLDQVLDRVRRDLLPYTLGNTHPRFHGWVHGAGSPAGALGEFLVGAMNANTGGRDHAPIRVEEQVVAWMRELFAFPEGSTGLVVSGTSMATVIGLAVARHAATEGEDRELGLHGWTGPRGLVGYTTEDGHRSLQDAFSLLGLGASALRIVPMGADGAMDVAALDAQVRADIAQGFRPFAVIATVGSVTCGAVDDLGAIREVADRHGLWLHVDGAFGAAARLSPVLAPRLAGIDRADSLAFDFHKWFHVPYEAGMVLVRHGELHRATFGGRADYLNSLDSGPAAGDLWPCELGPELSRGFRAFRVWFSLHHHGLRALGEAMEANVEQARRLAARVRREPELELMAPADLNIVCFRFRPPGAGNITEAEWNELNRDLLLELHHRGIAVPSPIKRDGRFGLRVCLCNHRTQDAEMDHLVEVVLALGRALVPVA
jgi:aromatic-L-amino-acid decarboxylase